MANTEFGDQSKNIEFISVDVDDYKGSEGKPIVKRIDDIKDKFIEFYSVKLPKRKTPVVAVYNKVTQEVIGEIKWYGPFRQYSFFPEDEIVLHDGCLSKIIECINYLKNQGVKIEDGKITHNDRN